MCKHDFHNVNYAIKEEFETWISKGRSSGIEGDKTESVNLEPGRLGLVQMRCILRGFAKIFVDAHVDISICWNPSALSSAYRPMGEDCKYLELEIDFARIC